MADAPPPTELVVSAIQLLTSRWHVSASASADALVQVADGLGLEVGDLAALVCAADHQQRLADQARRLRCFATAAAS